MKRTPLKRKTPLNTHAAQRRYEDRLRAEGHSRFRSLGSNRKRKARERERAYGPPERRAAVRAMVCEVESCNRLSENAHLTTGGTGRKADADTVANLCPEHHRTHTKSLHNLGSVELFDAEWETDLWAASEGIERKHPTARRVERERHG